MKSKSYSAAAFTGLALASQAQAFTIAIANGGFEADTVATNGVIVATPSSWTSTPLIATGGSIVDYVIDGSWYSPAGFTSAHSGDKYYLGGATTATPYTFNILSQDTPLLWSHLSAGDTMTVSVWAAYAGGVDGSPFTGFWLNYSDGAGIGSNFFNVSSTAPGLLPGKWTQLSWNYTVTQPILDAAAANSWGAVNVGIGFAAQPGTDQIGFDDFSLNSTAIPEPSAAGLLGVAAGLALTRRRRRN